MNKKDLTFHTPSIDELWFREMMLADGATMSYNRAWGGTIAFPREALGEWYERWIAKGDGRRFYRYAVNGDGEFVGEAAYHFDGERGIFLANVIIYAPHRGKGYGGAALDMLCDAAKERGIGELYDEIAIDNPAVSLFIKHGFTEEYRTDKTVMLKKELRQEAF